MVSLQSNSPILAYLEEFQVQGRQSEKRSRHSDSGSAHFLSGIPAVLKIMVARGGLNLLDLSEARLQRWRCGRGGWFWSALGRRTRALSGSL
jgi:hypothetical protein